MRLLKDCIGYILKIINKKIIIIIFPICIFYLIFSNLYKESLLRKDNFWYFNNNFNKINIKNRYIKVNRNAISVGKNLNEIDNGYYDFNIDIYKDKILLYLNKLFIEDTYMYIYEDKYLDNIINYINTLFNLNLDIKNYIIRNYIMMREINNPKIKKHFIFDIKNISIKCKIEKNILIIEI